MTEVTDFNAQQAAYWFGEACAYAELFGRIQAYLDATSDRQFSITPEEAIGKIRTAVDQFISVRENGGGAS